MRVSINKSELRESIPAPPSKSYTIRGLMCAALARWESELVHPLTSDDTEAAADVLGKLGVGIQRVGDRWRVTGGQFHQPDGDLFCRDSAATLRFMTAISAIVPGESRLTAGPSLAKRPVRLLLEALRRLGVECSAQGDMPPVVVRGGRFRGGATELPGDISSQYISALLLVAPFAEEGLTIRLTTPLESKPYVLMTIRCLNDFGVKVVHSSNLDRFEVQKQMYRPARYEVEGDWSSASYFLAMGALLGGVEITNLNPNSVQGDKKILNLLEEMGARVEMDGSSARVSRGGLKAIRADLSDCIDLLPTVAILAAAAEGTSELVGIARARIKESDRVAAVKEGLQKMGIKVGEARDSLTIIGTRPRGAAIDSHSDHRIAMAFSILGLYIGNTVIDGAECVSKTFPEFWDILKSIGGRITVDEQ
jgi:3-phosphoshikimate 1-carboxyvinyltransferase